MRRVVCPRCRETEAALNGGKRPAVQVAFGVTRPPGLQPWWTPDEDRVIAQCRTAAEAHGRLPWRSKVSCAYRFKTLRHAGRVRAFNHREWSPAEDARVAAVASPAAVRALAVELGRSLTGCFRRRGELRRRGHAVSRFRTGRPPDNRVTAFRRRRKASMMPRPEGRGNPPCFLKTGATA